MNQLVIYGTGSPLLVDMLESIRRAGLVVACGVRNRSGTGHLDPGDRAVSPEELTAEICGLPFLVPMFTPAHRQEAANEAMARGFSRPFSLIDPTVPLPQAISFEGGFYVNAGCTLGAASRFGKFVAINRGATVGHHAAFDDFVSVGPGAVICGQVSIGRGSFIGAGAVVLPTIRIGDNAVIGAGAVVTRDVESNCMVAGNPARVKDPAIRGHGGKAVN